jgi:hypothetical protein
VWRGPSPGSLAGWRGRRLHLMVPQWPPSRALLSLIRQRGPFQLNQLYDAAVESLAPGTFRSKTHYKECVKGLKKRKAVSAPSTFCQRSVCARGAGHATGSHRPAPPPPASLTRVCARAGVDVPLGARGQGLSCAGRHFSKCEHRQHPLEKAEGCHGQSMIIAAGCNCGGPGSPSAPVRPSPRRAGFGAATSTSWKCWPRWPLTPLAALASAMTPL